MRNQIIYVRLLNEGAEVFRPVLSQELKPMVFVLGADEYDPDDEEWEYPPGTLVYAEAHGFEDGLQGLLVSGRIIEGDSI
jgi:hypothetical protein